MKIIYLVLLVSLFASCAKSDNKVNTELTAEEYAAINKTCPVSDEMISKEEMVVVNHESKNYAFCCEKCVTKFKADPATYIAKLENMETETETMMEQKTEEASDSKEKTEKE
jgi:YHS domain-containing protein